MVTLSREVMTILFKVSTYVYIHQMGLIPLDQAICDQGLDE